MSARDQGQPISAARSAEGGGESATPIQPAATVMMLRQGPGKPEVLLVKRSERLVFGPGHWVFPGGRLDPDDYTASEPGGSWGAARNAAVRELREETQLCVDHSSLLPLSIWVTPNGPPRRFRAHFFACTMAPAQPVRVDGAEIVDYWWASVSAALDAHCAGTLPLMVPTRYTLELFADCDSLDDCLALCQARATEEFIG